MSGRLSDGAAFFMGEMMNEKFSAVAAKMIRRLSSDSENERIACLNALDRAFTKYSFSWEDLARMFEDEHESSETWIDKINEMLDLGEWTEKQRDFLLNMKYWKNKTEKQENYLESLWGKFTDKGGN